jgi:ribonucleoside-diphosphate reductase beta chain
MSNLNKKDNSRFVLFPIKYPELWRAYKEAEASFWTAEEIDLSADLVDWAKLTDNERYFISNVLAFFAASDGIVGENLAQRFYGDVCIPEARAFYGYQMATEMIHAETYSLLIDTYIKDPKEKEKLFNAIETIPIVKKKADWALKWIDSNECLEERLIAFAAVEGIFFSSSFCAVYWFKKRNLLSGLSFSGDLIFRDESLHCKFAHTLYSMSDNKISQERIYEIITEAVELECEFATESLPFELIGINSKLVCEYIKFVADYLLLSIGCKKLYNEQNPFDFMELISLVGKSNFFEKRVMNYQKSNVGQTQEANQISFDAEF